MLENYQPVGINTNYKEELRNLAKKYKIDLVFFHGRGGSAGRGGGPIQATLKSQAFKYC
jgi:phosphoenolpyruvate carboxylase